MLSKDYVTAPLIGATKVKYLDDALGAFEVALSAEIKYLEEAYVRGISRGTDRNDESLRMSRDSLGWRSSYLR